MEDWSLLRWISSVFAGLIAVFGVIVLLHGVVYGEWQLNWWYQQQNVNREAKLIQNGFNFQSALGQQITKGIDNVSQDSTEITIAEEDGNTAYANSLKGQRENDANTVCYQSTQINGSIPQGVPQGDWIKANCLNGSVSPESIYYYVGH